MDDIVTLRKKAELSALSKDKLAGMVIERDKKIRELNKALKTTWGRTE